MKKNTLWVVIAFIIVAIISFKLGAKSVTAPTIDSPVVTQPENTTAKVTPKPSVTTTGTKSVPFIPKPVTSGIRVYSPNGGDLWVTGTNVLIEAVITKGIANGSIDVALIDESGKNAFPLGTFKTDPLVEVQRMNVYIPNNRPLGKYKILVSLTIGTTPSGTDLSDDFLTIAK